MPVGKRDILHIEAIGRAMDAEKLADCGEWMRSSPAERVRIGFALGQVALSPAVELALDQQALEQIGLAKRRPAQKR